MTFIYQAWDCFDDYSEKRTLSDIGFINQDRFPLPSVCITTKKFSTVSFNSTFNITNRYWTEYNQGKWKVRGLALSERELWEFVSPKLSDLIEKIKVYKMIDNVSDRESKMKVSVENLSNFGIDIERKDNLRNPRIFCLKPRNLIYVSLNGFYNISF